MKVPSMFKTLRKGFGVRQQTDCGDPSSAHQQRNTITEQRERICSEVSPLWR